MEDKIREIIESINSDVTMSSGDLNYKVMEILHLIEGYKPCDNICAKCLKQNYEISN